GRSVDQAVGLPRGAAVARAGPEDLLAAVPVVEPGAEDQAVRTGGHPVQTFAGEGLLRVDPDGIGPGPALVGRTPGAEVAIMAAALLADDGRDNNGISRRADPRSPAHPEGQRRDL